MNTEQWHAELIGEKIVASLKKNHFDAIYFNNRQEATEYILGLILTGAVVGCGGSVTLQELKLAELAKAKGAQILDHNLPNLSPAEKLQIRRKQLTCDVFLSSTNAITMDGVLVNMDGVGNRVAAMTFGPEKVIIVAGINKICKDVHAAIERIKFVASPKNNHRLQTQNPCALKGYCMDCQGKSRICDVLSIMQKKPMATDITVVLIGEKLGY